MRQTNRCPIYNKSNIINLFTLDSVPVANNILCTSYEEAINFPMGKLDFIVCCDCGYAWNAAYNQDLLKYNSAHENNQSYSQAFQGRVDTVFSWFPLTALLHPANIVEVGCGQGYFLRKKKSKLGERVAAAVGFDPAVRKENESSELTVGILDKDAYPKFFSPDIFVSRHVIEPIEDVNSFVLRICKNTSSCRYGILETPSLEWIVNTKAYFDLYYEHCSLFTEFSLALLLQNNGFTHCNVELLFQDQYLLVTGDKLGEKSSHLLDKSFSENIINFANDFEKYIDTWIKKLHLLKKKYNKVGIWEVASKGVNFLHHMHANGLTVGCCVDINLQKQGKFTPRCGIPILNPEDAWAEGVYSFIVANPNYISEIAQTCSDASVRTILTPLQ